MKSSTYLLAPLKGLMVLASLGLALLAPRQAWAAEDGWRSCADEGQTCRFRGKAQVRFGQGGRFVTRTAFGSVRCDSDSFGGDPYKDRVKACEIRR